MTRRRETSCHTPIAVLEARGRRRYTLTAAAAALRAAAGAHTRPGSPAEACGCRKLSCGR